MLTAWLASFALTCAVELAVVTALRGWRRPAIILATQLATHPAAWIAMGILPLPTLAALALVEGGVTVAEALVYRRALGLAATDALATSALANAASIAAAAGIAALAS